MNDVRDTSDLDLGFDLELTKIKQRNSGGGTWVSGTLHGHRFDALVFPEHAETPEYELDQSRISKLWVQRLADSETVFSFDRGLDIPATDAVAQAIADFLAAGLADVIYED